MFSLGLVCIVEPQHKFSCLLCHITIYSQNFYHLNIHPQEGFDPPKQSATQVLKLSRRSTSKPPRLDLLMLNSFQKCWLDKDGKKLKTISEIVSFFLLKICQCIFLESHKNCWKNAFEHALGSKNWYHYFVNSNIIYIDSVPYFFVMMLQGLMMVWLAIQLAFDQASSAVWLLLCWSPGWWLSKL